MESLKEAQRGDIQKENVARFLTGTDAYEEELIVMAETAAYFHVAYKVRTQHRNVPRITPLQYLLTSGLSTTSLGSSTMIT